MWWKKTAAVWLAFIFIFSTCCGNVSAATAYAAQENTVSDSTVQGDTAQETQESSAQEDTDYTEISEMISENWEDDYFEAMTVEPGTNNVEKDGEEEKLSKEFGISTSKAKAISESEESMENYLEKQEGVYEVEENEEGDLEITAPYQTKRLIVLNSSVEDTYGAKEVYENGADGETILQYETEEETEAACEALKKEYGDDNCFADAVISLEGISATETDGSAETAEASVEALSGGTSSVSVSSQADSVATGCYTWGASYMGMDVLKQEAASLGYTQKVTVAIADTGIASDHPMFDGRTISKSSTSFIDHSLRDLHGHGTHVAGIIADSTPSNVELLVLKIADSQGASTIATMGYALYYAIDAGANVINFSLGYPADDAYTVHYLDDVIDKAYERGIPICTAAGNESADTSKSYPACNSEVITVSAINSDGSFASYSNRGSAIDFAAPGTEVVSAYYEGGLVYMTGTSMAAPHITAAAAYIKMAKPNISVKGLYKELKYYCKDLGTSGKDKYYGWGCPVLTNFLKKGITYKKYVVILTPTLKSVTNTKKGVKLKWKKTTGAAKYCIYRKKNSGAWEKIAVVSSAQTSYIDKKVKQGDKCQYRVRAKNSGKYGRYSSTKKIWRLKTMATPKLRRKSGKKVQVSWNKKRYAGRYQIQYAKNENFKNSKKISVSGSKKSVVTKKLKKGTWYFRVRYSRTKSGIKSWSGWSTTAKIRIR